MSEIDVYHQWLGIPPEQQPPSLYRLLGLVEFESDPDVIRSAAERQAMHVRRLSRGEFIDAGQELLNEIALAKLQLIDSEKRASYDEGLRQLLDQQDEPAVQPNRTTHTEDELPAETEPRQEEPSNIMLKTVKATILDLGDTALQSGRSWVIGYHPDCDIRVDHETVSGMHCRLKRLDDHWQVVDLKSTNGTFVNGKRVVKARFDRNDLFVLGGDHRVIVPPEDIRTRLETKKAFFIGRADGNEIQVDSQRVSRFHARITIDGEIMAIDDLNSARGTYLVTDKQKPVRITRCVLRPDDVIRFADFELSAQSLLSVVRSNET